MIKLKNILAEGFAWERKEDGSLPTLADTTAAYEAKLREEAELNMPFDDESKESDVDESAKPDFFDADNDGDEEESMKKAFADKEEKNESALIKKSGLQEMREIPLEQRILRNLKGNDYILREEFRIQEQFSNDPGGLKDLQFKLISKFIELGNGSPEYKDPGMMDQFFNDYQTEYTDWLSRNGFKPTDVTIDRTNASRVSVLFKQKTATRSWKK